tara:strand:- start:208 stop:471 length:264 start_codon:yes stop_codon:yes gene_type:complete
MEEKVEKVEKIVIKPGRPWQNVTRYGNFSDADSKRNQLLAESDEIDVKVKRCGNGGLRFVVKSRNKVEPEQKTQKKSKKQKQKKDNA